jgi:hypothetical protein
MTATLFDHVNAIYSNQSQEYWENLSDADRKSWSDYMINRFISMNMNCVEIVNEANCYYGQIKGRELYLFYSQLLPKGKQFNKYIKGAKDEGHEDWVLETVSRHFLVSHDEASTYIELCYRSTEGKQYLRQLLEGYGIDAKRLKKVKL